MTTPPPQVVAMDSDEDRVRILQHADCFVNKPSPRGRVRTGEYFSFFQNSLVVVLRLPVFLIIVFVLRAIHNLRHSQFVN